VASLLAAGQEALVIWDESVLEKAESDHNRDYCSVRSSKARRLTRIRKGFFQPPISRRPICVAGLHSIGLLVSGLAGTPSVALMQWWTTRGAHAREQKVVAGQLLFCCRRQWGRQVRHVWDRGFAKSQWLYQVLERNLRFVLRWPKRYRLLDNWGEARPAWQIARGKRTWNTRQLYDSHTGTRQKVGVLAIPVARGGAGICTALANRAELAL